MNALNKFVFLSLLSCFVLNGLLAQAPLDWKESHDKGNRFEGSYEALKKEIEGVELVSIMSAMDPYTIGSGQNLTIRFYSPFKTQYFLSASDAESKTNYWMEGKSTAAVEGWNELSPIPVDEEIKNHSVRPNSLAVLVRMGKADNKRILPAMVYHDERPKAFPYIIHLRINEDLFESYFSLYKGVYDAKHLDEEERILNGRLAEMPKGMMVPLQLPEEQLLGYEGWVTFHYAYRTRENAPATEFVYYFYHHNEVK